MPYPQWEMSHATSEENIFEYPDRNLLHSLVSLYFEKSNIIMPILHRPTFLRSLNSGLHLRDPAFGMTVLLVCAIGSRFISNGDVLLDNDISQLSAGWKYFVQVPIFRKALYVRSTLYDLQCCVVRHFSILNRRCLADFLNSLQSFISWEHQRPMSLGPY